MVIFSFLSWLAVLSFQAMAKGGLVSEDRLLYADEVTSTSVTLSWKQIDSSSSPVVLYDLLYKKGNSSGSYTNVESVVHQPNQIYATSTVSNLAFNTKYVFRVKAEDNNGTVVENYPDVVVKTSCQDPRVPENVQFIPSMSTTTRAKIFVSFKPLAEMFSGCDAISGVWMYYRASNERTWTTEVIPLNVTTHTAEPSSGGGRYDAMVLIQNNEGFVDSTGIKTVTIKGTGIRTPGGPDVTRTRCDVIAYLASVVVLAVVAVVLITVIIVCGVKRCRDQVRSNEKTHPEVGSPVQLTVPGRTQSQVSTGQYLSVPRPFTAVPVEGRANTVMPTNNDRLAEDREAYLTPHDYLQPREYLTPQTLFGSTPDI